MSGTHWGPFVCGAGEVGRGAKSLGSGGEGSRVTSSVRRLGARSHAHKTVRPLPGCLLGAARSSVLDEASAGSLRDGARCDERAAGGDRPAHGLEGRSVEGRGSAGVPGQEGHSRVSLPRGSK